MKSRLTSLILIAVLFALPMSALAANPLKGISVTDTGGNLTNGTLDVTSFAVEQGKLVAKGTLRGTLNNQQVNQAVTIPVNVTGATCDILNLELGPLHLDLLGLVVDLSKVNLDITAQQGSGKLLGNLLCSIAQLLDKDKTNMRPIAAKLNQVLRTLG